MPFLLITGFRLVVLVALLGVLVAGECETGAVVRAVPGRLEEAAPLERVADAEGLGIAGEDGAG